MTPFVNFNKRSVTLPAGCKDLIDVLRKPGRAIQGDFTSSPQLEVTHREEVTGTPKDIARYVGMVLASQAATCDLHINPLDQPVTVSVSRLKDHFVSASVKVRMDTELEKAVRHFFDRHGFQAPTDSAMPACFDPHLPVELICHIEPIPSDAPLLAQVIADLFASVCGLACDSALHFNYVEMKEAAESGN